MEHKLIMILVLDIAYKVAFTAVKLYPIYFRVFELNCGFWYAFFSAEKKAIHHNIIVIQALDRVYKVTFTDGELYSIRRKVTFTDDELYSIRLRLMEYNSSSVNVTLYTLSRAWITYNVGDGLKWSFDNKAMCIFTCVTNSDSMSNSRWMNLAIFGKNAKMVTQVQTYDYSSFLTPPCKR